LRTKCDRNSSFLDLLKQVKDVTLGAYSHQDLPFEQLVEELKPERHLNRNPLFDVMFTLQNAPESKLTLPGLTLSPIEEEGRSTIFDLSIDMFESDSGLKGILQYSTDLFESSTIQRMLGHFQILLKAIVSQPKTSLSELSLLTEEEKQQVLYQWNNNQAEYPVDRCIHTLFEEQVNQTPDAVAAVFKDCSLTYRQLNEQANQLARCLQNCGLVTGEFVGIYQGRSLSFLISILAILKVGAVYIPMDNTYPFERIEYMLSNSQVRFLLADSQCSKILLDSSQDHTELKYLICLDSLAAKKSKHLTILGRESWQNLSTVNPAITQTGSDPAYMIYTSGSTGVPKGTIIRHGGAINHIYAQYDALNLNSDLTFLQSAPASSDISVWQFLAPLLTGGKTIIIDTETVCNSEQLFQVIQQSNITLVELVPVVLRGLINYLSSLSLEARKLPSLQWMMVTGESVSVDLVNQWLKLYPTIPIVNAYGPSEASDDITQAIINRPLADNQNTVTIGKPLANLNLHILDSNLQLLPIGIPGEICVSGYGVGIGYWQNEAKTQKNFIPNPFPETAKPLPGVETDLLYKTGDLGRWLPDGSIEYLGRIDNQVKIRGFRIELEEIETVIARHPLISDCVVIDRGDNLRDKRLIAYYIAPQTLEVKQLREFLKSKLPDYMIPAAWMQLDAFPLTPNGKCDRNALPTPDFALTTTNYIAPRTPQEEILANIWQEVLNIDKVGIDDNFFELGGHSLLATQVVSKIRHSLSVELPLRSLFEFPTVAELTYQLQGISLTELPSIQPVARDGYLPLSFAQQRLWFLAQLEPDSPAYNIPEVLRLQGRLDINVLTETLTAIIQRHEVFRTTFTIVAGEPVQVIKPTVDFRLPIIDLVSLPKAIQEQEVKKLTEQEALKAFDLARDSLLRVTLIRFDDLEHIILFTMHHIISDGWSTGILVQEVTTLYQAFLEGKPSPLPKLSIQYADYAVWQREWLQGDILEAQLSYWQSKLGGELPILKLPIANPQLNVRTFRGGQQSLIIAKALSDELKNLSIKHGVTLFMTLLAAFQTLLHWYTDGEDIIIGTDIANRHQSETENLIGFFVNQLVLRNDFSGNPNFQELLTRTRQVTLDAYANQDLPFDKLVEVLNPKRSLSHQPLFQVKMILQNTPISSLELPDLKISSIDLDKKIAEYDLLLDLEDTEIGLNGLLKYDADLFKANKIAEFIKNFKLILSTIAQQPKLKLSELKAILNQAAEQQNQSQRDEYQVTLTRNLGKVQRKSLI
jgi:amino acid adenylation domain-containing protein